jgi:predicted RNA-binding Zn-ribbon protein involved in translation (DUF1610 family)
MRTAGGYRLDITCCFCGGKLDVDEAGHTVDCPHCASVLKITRTSGTRKYVIPDGLLPREVKFHIERHIKKEGLPLPSHWQELKRVYVPFWRVTGTVFSIATAPDNCRKELFGTDTCEAEESPAPGVTITNRDVSFCADETFNWGVESLGVRTQTLHLAPLEREFYENNQLLPPVLSLEHAKDRFDRATTMAAVTTADVGADVQLTSVGLDGTLIYFPVWAANFISAEGRRTVRFDPLAKRVVALDYGGAEVPGGTATFAQDTAAIRIIPHRCPNCGTDLPNARWSATYYCANCRRLYVEAANGYQQLTVHVPENRNVKDMLFPFWVFNLQSADWPGKEEFLRALQLTRYRNDAFYVPAFGVANPERLMRLVGHYNRRVHQFMFKEIPDEKYTFADVTVSPEQAVCLIIPLTAAAVAQAGYPPPEALRGGALDVAAPDLIWLPYAPDRYFWREQITGATIEKAAVRC